MGFLTPAEARACEVVRQAAQRLRAGDDPPERATKLLLLDYLLAELPALAPDPSGRAAPGAAAEGATPARVERGVFHERPGGAGTVAFAGGQIGLPPKVVAAARLCEGDSVGLEPVGLLPDGSPRYFFRNLGGGESAPPPVTGFVRLADGELWLMAGGQRAGRLRGDEAARWNVRAGDVLTGSVGRDGAVRVVRVHPASPVVRATGQRRVRRRRGPASGAPRPAATRLASGPRFPRPTRVALIGGHDANGPYYRRLFTGLGAELDFLPGGTYSRGRVEDVVDRSDAVVLLTQCAGHEMIGVAWDRARTTRKPVLVGATENWSGLLRQLRRELIPRLA